MTPVYSKSNPISTNDKTEEIEPGGGLVNPKRPTYARWRSLAFTGLSLLRSLQYEAIKGVRLHGRVLDVGGDKRSAYHALFAGNPEFHTINLDDKTEPTFKFDLEAALPLPDGSYDHVISLNTFEHIRNDELAVREALRALKPGGTFHILVPFLYRVHGSPRDFNRRAPDWWDAIMISQWITDYAIEPLVWDGLSSGLAVAGRRGLTQKLFMFLSLFDLPGIIYRLRNPRESRTLRERAKMISRARVAVGYYIRGIKPV